MHPDGEANWPVVPCVVLDPFLGSGTTAAVAVGLERDWVGCEIKPEYAAMAEQRIRAARCGEKRAAKMDPGQLLLWGVDP